MEITKYLCEFFFTDFWHWLGLTIMLCVFRFGIVTIDKSHNVINKTKKED